MFLLKQFLPAVAVAAVVAAVIPAFFLRSRSARALRMDRGTRTGVATACALGAGYFAGHLFITGWTPFPPADTTNWLPYFALAAAAIGALAPALTARAAKIAGVVVFALVCVGAMRLLLAPKFRYGWSAEQGWMWVGGLASVTLLLALCIVTMERRSAIAIEPPLTLIIVSAGTAGALIMSGSILLAQFAAGLSAAALGSHAWCLRDRNDSGGAAASVFSLLLVTLLTSGYFFADLPALSAILLVTAPAAALLPISASRFATTVRLAVIVAAVSGALLAAFRSSPSWSE